MTPPRQSLSWAVPILKLAFLVAILVWIVSTFPKKDWDTLVAQEKNWALLGSALLSALAAHLITFWRWRTLIAALDVPLKLLDAVRLGFLGTMLNMVSVGAVGGDLFKAIAAARMTQRRRTEVITSVLVDRAIGLLGLVIVAAISLSMAKELSVNLQWIRAGAATLSGIGLLALILIVFLGHRLPLKFLHRIPWIGHSLYRVANACLVFQGRPGLVLQMLVSTLCVHSLLTIACCLISNALYMNPPTVFQHFQAIPPAMAAATLPLTPGGVGVQEVAIDRLFQEVQGIPEGFSGLIVAAMYRVILIAIAAIGALVYFSGSERKWVSAERA
jgi:glycosyltransferase 2 family protein